MARNRVDELIEMDRNGEPRAETISRDQKKVALGRLGRNGDAFKVVRRRIDINKGKRDRPAKADGDTSTSFPVEYVSVDNRETIKIGIDTGAKSYFVQQENIIVVG